MAKPVKTELSFDWERLDLPVVWDVELETPFSLEEIKEEVFRSYVDGSSGPDGTPMHFYQRYWD